jgi:hypothetical protein
MNKHCKQQDIQQQESKDTLQTNAWLKSQGLRSDDFTELDLQLVHAQRIAHNCLKHHAELLGQNEAQVLNNFLQALSNKAKRQRMTQAQAFKIMNIGTGVNRRVFKQFKKTNNAG